MSDLEQTVGFWSYTHRDDELSRGRIRQLAKDISDDYELLTAERLRIFVDKNELEWGAEWETRIEAALTGTTFFIPIVTPGYLKSEECRKELLTFSGHARSLGLDELLLPIIYVPVAGLTDKDNPDEVARLIASRQFVDWTRIRLFGSESPEYRKSVADLATRIISITERSVQVASVNEGEIAESDESPALLETMAEAEAAMPRWVEVLNEFSSVMQLIGDEAREAAEEITRSDARGAGFAGRLRVSRQLVEKISAPVDRFYELGNQYATELLNVDPGILTVVREVTNSELTEEDKAAAAEFFTTIIHLVETSRNNVPTLREFIDSIDQLRGLSKAMRPLVARMKLSLQKVLDGQAIMEEWIRLIGESGLPLESSN
jgi:hypothetical protein